MGHQPPVFSARAATILISGRKQALSESQVCGINRRVRQDQQQHRLSGWRRSRTSRVESGQARSGQVRSDRVTKANLVLRHSAGKKAREGRAGEQNKTFT